MMTTDTATPAEIAAGLTETQRWAIGLANPGLHWSRGTLHTRTLRALQAKGLLDAGARHTGLGRAVAEYVRGR